MNQNYIFETKLLTFLVYTDFLWKSTFKSDHLCKISYQIDIILSRLSKELKKIYKNQYHILNETNNITWNVKRNDVF